MVAGALRPACRLQHSRSISANTQPVSFGKRPCFTSVQIPNGAVGSVAEVAAQTRRQSETSATWSQPYPVLASDEPMSPWLRNAL